MKNKKKDYCIIIAAINEERVIGNTLRRLSKILPPKDIYVIDDGSTDSTAIVAKRYTKNVLSIQNSGKAKALRIGIKHFDLVRNYNYITPNDADSNLNPDFFKHVARAFESNKDVVAVAGKVVGSNYNWITSFRLWEYELTQTIHKSAQSHIGTVAVCPGPCSVYKSSLFNKISFPTGTVTEDMDLTFNIHRKKLGKIVYEPNSISYTQDPRDIKTYSRQINRWYTGFWQCLIKHNIPRGKSKLDVELSILAIEGLFNGLFSLSLIAFVPYLFLNAPMLLLYTLAVDLFLFMLPTTIFVAYRYSAWNIVTYIPSFYLLRIISSLIFLKNYGTVVLGVDKKLGASWDTPRYKVLAQKFRLGTLQK